MSNQAETEFHAFAARRFKKAVRLGWPDFFVPRAGKTGCLCVEVKQGKDTISPTQKAMFTALEAAGLRVVVWNPACPQLFTPWRDYKPFKRPQIPRKIKPHVVVYLRLKRSVRKAIAAIAKKRGLPHTGSSVAVELLARGLAAEPT